MKKQIISLSIMSLIAFTAIAQTKAEKPSKPKKDSLVFSHNIGYGLERPLNNYTCLYIKGKVVFTSKNGWLITVQDTTKLCIKYQDSIFVLHISPKFVKKINDSTYTFKNEK